MPTKYKKIIVYCSVLVAAAGISFLKPVTNSLEGTVIETTALPLRVVLFPFKELRKLILFHHTFQEYVKIKKEVEVLRGHLITQGETLRENKRLKELLNFKDALAFPSLGANVIGRDPTNWNAAILIDRGARDGVKINQPVVTASGIIGKVAEVERRTSKVLLLNDSNFSVVGVTQRSREIGLVSGTLDGSCRMRYLSPEADVVVGDIVVTSKLSSAFPEGLLIGKIASIDESQSSPTTECLIEPVVSLSQLEEVLVLLK